MRHCALTLITAAIAALPGQSSAADLSGHWRFFERDAVKVAPRTVDHSADFILFQRADRIYGTWSENGHRLSEGCLKGNVKARSLLAELCLQDGSFGSESGAVCPKYAPPRDRFDLSGKSLVWHRYNEQARKWEKYLTLTKRNPVSKAAWPKECGADKPQADD